MVQNDTGKPRFNAAPTAYNARLPDFIQRQNQFDLSHAFTVSPDTPIDTLISRYIRILESSSFEYRVKRIPGVADTAPFNTRCPFRILTAVTKGRAHKIGGQFIGYHLQAWSVPPSYTTVEDLVNDKAIQAHKEGEVFILNIRSSHSISTRQTLLLIPLYIEPKQPGFGPRAGTTHHFSLHRRLYHKLMHDELDCNIVDPAFRSPYQDAEWDDPALATDQEDHDRYDGSDDESSDATTPRQVRAVCTLIIYARLTDHFRPRTCLINLTVTLPMRRLALAVGPEHLRLTAYRASIHQPQHPLDKQQQIKLPSST